MTAKNKFKKRNNISNSFEVIYWIGFVLTAILLFYPPYFRGLFFQTEQQWTLILAAVAFGFVAFWKLLKKERILITFLDFAVLVLIISYFISSFGAASQKLAVAEIVKYALYFFVYWTVSRLARDKNKLLVLLNILYISAVGVALAGIFTALGYIDIKDGYLGGRIYSTLQYPNALASYLLAVLFLGTGLWLKIKNSWCKYLYTAGNFIIFTVFLATGSRGGFLLLPILLIIYILGLKKKRLEGSTYLLFILVSGIITNIKLIPMIESQNDAAVWGFILLGLVISLIGQFLVSLIEKKDEKIKKTISIILIIVLVIGIIGSAIFFKEILPDNIMNRITRINIEEGSSLSRIYWSGEALNIFKEKPLFGMGGGAWEASYRHFQSYLYPSTQVHNHWMQVLIEVGLVGFLIFVSIWVFFIIRSVKNYINLKDNDKLLQWSILVSAVGLGAHALIDFDLSLSAVTILLFSLFGATRALGEIVNPIESKYFKKYNYAVALTLILIFILLPGFLLAAQSSAKNAITEIKEKDIVDAVDYFEDASRFDPFNAEYKIDLAQLHLKLKNEDEAVKNISKAVKIDKYNWRIHEKAGEMYWKLGDINKAVEEFEKSRDSYRWDQNRWDKLSRIYSYAGLGKLQDGNKEEALKWFKKVSEVPEIIDNRISNLDDTTIKLWNKNKWLKTSSKIHSSAGIGCYFLQDYNKSSQHFYKSVSDIKESYWWIVLVEDKIKNNGTKEGYSIYIIFDEVISTWTKRDNVDLLRLCLSDSISNHDDIFKSGIGNTILIDTKSNKKLEVISASGYDNKNNIGKYFTNENGLWLIVEKGYRPENINYKFSYKLKEPWLDFAKREYPEYEDQYKAIKHLERKYFNN